jgi:hypothetical protein
MWFPFVGPLKPWVPARLTQVDGINPHLYKFNGGNAHNWGAILECEMKNKLCISFLTQEVIHCLGVGSFLVIYYDQNLIIIITSFSRSTNCRTS